MENLQTNDRKHARLAAVEELAVKVLDDSDIKEKYRAYSIYSYCLLSVLISFVLGLSIGVLITRPDPKRQTDRITKARQGRRLDTANVSYTGVAFVNNQRSDFNRQIYPKHLNDDLRDILKDNKGTNVNFPRTPNENTVLYDNVYWGPEIENSMPQGYGENSAELWERYVGSSEVVKMEIGCGRMQNRLVTFRDGTRACVRYRQNTDQIQGEIFSFYVGRLLNLTNLAPSVVKIVDLKDKLWRNVVNDIAAAKWSRNRAIVLTQYVPSLEPAHIPDVFKSSTRHLNKIDVYNMSNEENETSDITKELLIEKMRIKDVRSKAKNIEKFSRIDMRLNDKTVKSFLELAQWSDLIVFDYLTANLDRIVNNLFNYQWNENIMNGPAHNLAKKMDSGLLVFLDNESGLLHGYRLLKKYNVYHSLLLDSLCVFRKSTIDALKRLHYKQDVGAKLSDMFHLRNSAVVRDVLPALPEKNSKVLHERIGRVLSQVQKCEEALR
ncbi:extracellular serine/threonine protein kinase four-jointed [Bombyx mori]|uniref:Extracellular serine/threonine protein kinase four-jointed n=1 Tax=Bombyx mori TaxID=7091 RepID=A0A8R2C5U6_BOMMO|nr:extracellular serine/threonine protein kinase four-jointed [Bombyx mori]